MNKTLAKRILNEHSNRNNSKIQWLDPEFKAQNDFINDPALLKAAQCTRRAGKSYGCGLYLFKEAYDTPYCDVLYIGLTRDSAKRVMFQSVLGDINRKLKLNAKPNVSDLTYTLGNKSTIKLLGVDAKPDDMNKLLGGKYKLVIIDEAAFFRQDLRKLIYEVLVPATADHEGTIAIISTTSDITKSLYYDITNDIEKGWSVHKWTTKDNPHMKVKHAKQVKVLTTNNPEIVDTPMYKRMYLNQWFIDNDSLIYKFSKNSNLIPSLPNNKGYQYILGIDLGWDDPTAMVVCCYHPNDPTLYILDTFKKSKMTFDQVAEKIQSLDKIYNFQTMVIDNANKQGVEQMRARYNLPLIAADKHGKRDHIGLMNADLVKSHIKLVEHTTIPLQDEWSNLIWDARKKELGKYEEHASCANHLCDAALYAWRWAYQYGWEALEVDHKVDSIELVDEWWDKQADKLEEDDDRPQWEIDLEEEGNW